MANDKPGPDDQPKTIMLYGKPVPFDEYEPLQPNEVEKL